MSSLKMLKWTIDNGCEIDPDICAYAAECGNLDVLMWLRNHNQHQHRYNQWNHSTYYSAARNNHIHIMQYIYDCRSLYPCSWNESILCVAASNGHLDVLKWCYKRWGPCRRPSNAGSARADSRCRPT